MKLRTNSRESGSVLLETVIALPLFMVLIGGILWLGQLIYDKQKLVIADRYVAWNFGNRHGTGYNADQVRKDLQNLFPSFAQEVYDQVQSINPATCSEGQWWHLVYASVGLKDTMPLWTRGWLPADATMTGWTLKMDNTTPQFFGRLDATESQAGGHSVVMRTMRGDESEGQAHYDTRFLRPSVDTTPVGINYRDIENEDYPVK